MKKIIFLLSALFCIGIVSCKHEYVCSCDRTYITGDSTGASVTNYTLYPYTDTKRKAQDRCKTNNTTQMDESGAYDIKCRIR